MSDSLTLSTIVVLQVAAQIGFQLLALALLGVGVDSDAFVAAQVVPMTLTGIFAMSLQSVWQARLAVADVDSGAWRGMHRIAHAQAMIVFAAAGLALAISAPLWLRALYAGFDPATRSLVQGLSLPLLLACLFSGAAAVLTAAQRGRGRLISPEVVSLLGSVAAVGILWAVVPVWGVHAAAWTVLARAVLVWLSLWWLVGGSPPDWSAAWSDRRSWKRLRPLAASSGIYKTAPLVDRFWTALGPTGSVTLFGLAHGGMGALASVIERALCMPVGPRIARTLAQGNVHDVRRMYRQCVLAAALASSALAALLLLLRPWWSTVLHHLLGLPQEPAATLWLLCGLLLGYTFVAAAGTAVVSVFYALGDTRTPATIGLTGFAVGIVAKSAGFLVYGVDGLALATSLYYLANLAALVLAVERRLVRLSATDRSIVEAPPQPAP